MFSDACKMVPESRLDLENCLYYGIPTVNGSCTLPSESSTKWNAGRKPPFMWRLMCPNTY